MVNQNLCKVYFDENIIEDEGVESWARALKCNCTEETIGLGENHIPNIVVVDDIEAILADPNRKVPKK